MTKGIATTHMTPLHSESQTPLARWQSHENADSTETGSVLGEQDKPCANCTCVLSRDTSSPKAAPCKNCDCGRASGMMAKENVVGRASRRASQDVKPVPMPANGPPIVACLDAPKMSTSCDACTFCDDVCPEASCHACREVERDLSARDCLKKVFTMCQIRRRCTEASCWLVVDKKVYDATDYVKSGAHPGRNRSILRKAGKDATEDFQMHSKKAKKLWKSMCIGKVIKCPKENCTQTGKKPWNLSQW